MDSVAFAAPDGGVCLIQQIFIVPKNHYLVNKPMSHRSVGRPSMAALLGVLALGYTLKRPGGRQTSKRHVTTQPLTPSPHRGYLSPAREGHSFFCRHMCGWHPQPFVWRGTIACERNTSPGTHAMETHTGQTSRRGNASIVECAPTTAKEDWPGRPTPAVVAL